MAAAVLLTCLLAFGAATSAHRATDEPRHRSAVTASEPAVVVGDQHASPRPDLHAVLTAAVPQQTSTSAYRTEDSSTISKGRTAGSPAARGPPGQALA